MRRTLTALAIGMAMLPIPAARVEAAVPIVVIDGKGFGHGVGMAQEGARFMGAAGNSTEQIFGQFYPGATYGRARGPVRVPVLDAGAAPTSALLGFPDGGEIREEGAGPASPGFPVRVPRGAQVRIVFSGGRYRVENPGGGPVALGRTEMTVATALIRSTRPQVPTIPGMTTTTTAPGQPPPDPTPTTTPPPPGPPPSTTTTTAPAPTPTTTTTSPSNPNPPPPASDEPPPGPTPAPGTEPAPTPGAAPAPSSARPLVSVPGGGGSVEVLGRRARYRGVIEATAASGTLRFVNTVDVETYLKGMGEVLDPTWPPAALRAQAVAARTYAMRAMAAGGEICDTQRCQVYLGSQAEYPAMNKAVDDSRERVLTFGGALISAVYSANGGAFTANREEGFGVVDDSIPYLRAAPYSTNNPGAWTVTVALSDVGARLGYAGTVTDVRISRMGPSQRAIEVTLEGSSGPKTVTGLNFDANLGLRSTLFTLRIESGEAPPPPPADEAPVLQAQPDEAAAAVDAEVATATTTSPTARPSAAIDRAAPAGDDRRLHQLTIIGSWLLTALLGGVALAVRAGGWPWSMRRPSPSALRTEDGSP